MGYSSGYLPQVPPPLGNPQGTLSGLPPVTLPGLPLGYPQATIPGLPIGHPLGLYLQLPPRPGNLQGQATSKARLPLWLPFRATCTLPPLVSLPKIPSKGYFKVLSLLPLLLLLPFYLILECGSAGLGRIKRKFFEFGYYLIQGIVGSGVAQVAEIRGCTTFMGHKKRHNSR